MRTPTIAGRVAPAGSMPSRHGHPLRQAVARAIALFLAVFAAGVLSGCLLDIYGGAPRVQLENRTTLPVRSITLGPPGASAWSHTFAPSVTPGKRSQTFDLPAAGDLRLFATFEGTDSVRALETGRFEPGTFTRIVLQDSVAQP